MGDTIRVHDEKNELIGQTRSELRMIDGVCRSQFGLKLPKKAFYTFGVGKDDDEPGVTISSDELKARDNRVELINRCSAYACTVSLGP